MAPEGSAQRAVAARYGPVLADLARLTADVRPGHPTSSAFAFVVDPAAGRHTTDASAVALELDVLVRAMTEQPFPAALGVAPAPAGSRAPAGTLPPAGAASAEVGGAVATAGEKLELAHQALANGWYREAEQLYLAAAALTPTDPTAWFGAGLASFRASRARAAEYLARASRYLLVTDPAGAAYAAVLAAGLHEQSGDRPMARQLLRDLLAQLGQPCPAVSVHLARLGPDRAWRVEEALSADTLLEADLVALGLAPGAEAVIARTRQIEAEVARLDAVIAGLRRVDGGPAWPDPPRLPAGPATARLPLSALELALAAKMAVCRDELERARALVAEREAARRAREDRWRQRRGDAALDLVHPVTVPVFWACAALAVGLVILALAGNLVAAAAPSLGPVIVPVLWAAAVGAVAGAGWLVGRAWWPRRRFADARAAKVALPQLRFEAGRLREEEFEVRRRYRQARAEAEAELQRIVERRRFLTPCRPTVCDLAPGGPVPVTGPATTASTIDRRGGDAGLPKPGIALVIPPAAGPAPSPGPRRRPQPASDRWVDGRVP